MCLNPKALNNLNARDREASWKNKQSNKQRINDNMYSYQRPTQGTYEFSLSRTHLSCLYQNGRDCMTFAIILTNFPYLRRCASFRGGVRIVKVGIEWISLFRTKRSVRYREVLKIFWRQEVHELWQVRVQPPFAFLSKEEERMLFLNHARQTFEVTEAQTSGIVNLVLSRKTGFFECEHPFIDKPMAITEPLWQAHSY